MRGALLGLILLLAAGCARATTEVQPGTGARPGAPPGHPGQMRLAVATSPDGLTFTPAGRHIADQGGVPNALIDKSGRLRVYYNDIFNGDQITVAVSRDQGRSWRYHRVEIAGLPERHSNPADPTVVKLDDGRYRLYFTLAVGGPLPRTWSALSQDGYRFQVEGLRWQPERGGLYDPIVARVGGRWALLVMNDQEIRLLLSTDGLHFVPAPTPAALVGLRTGNCLTLEDGRARCYLFDKDARSVISADGETWAPEAGIRLRAATEPAVARLKDGSYLMIYQQPLTAR